MIALALSRPISSIVKQSHVSILSLISVQDGLVRLCCTRWFISLCPSPYPLQLWIILAFTNCRLAMPVVAVTCTFFFSVCNCLLICLQMHKHSNLLFKGVPVCIGGSESKNTIKGDDGALQ